MKIIEVTQLNAWIQANQRDETVPVPVPTPTPVPIPTPLPIPPAPTPTGVLGSKTNPIKLDKPTTKVANGYIPSTSPNNSRGNYVTYAGSKLYFEVDPFVTTGRSSKGFGLQIKFYNQGLSVYKSTQNKATGLYSTEVRKIGGYVDIVYDNKPDKIDNTRYLYAIDNITNTSFNIEIWAEIQVY